jgi:hypothetical protein
MAAANSERFNPVVGEWLVAFEGAENKDRFMVGLMCSLIDNVGDAVVMQCIADAVVFDKKGAR